MDRVLIILFGQVRVDFGEPLQSYSKIGLDDTLGEHIVLKLPRFKFSDSMVGLKFLEKTAMIVLSEREFSNLSKVLSEQGNKKDLIQLQLFLKKNYSKKRDWTVNKLM